jgi:hypothetical protein
MLKNWQMDPSKAVSDLLKPVELAATANYSPTKTNQRVNLGGGKSIMKSGSSLDIEKSGRGQRKVTVALSPEKSKEKVNPLLKGIGAAVGHKLKITHSKLQDERYMKKKHEAEALVDQARSVTKILGTISNQE